MEAGTEEIFVSSPGKVILFGEHAVVYGKPALAACLDLCTFVHAKRRNDKNVSLTFSDLDNTPQCQWTLKEISEPLQGFMRKDVHNVDAFSVEDAEECLKNVEKLDFLEHQIRSAMSVFLYLYSSIVGSKGNDLIPLDVKVASCLPIGAGLGSSASYTTCLSTAMLRVVKAIGEKELSGADLHLVNRWAFSAEHILHGKPSGVDNAVSVFGGLINFKAGEITPVKCPVILEIILVNTKVVRETKQLVDKVRKRKSDWPTVIQPVLEAIGGITDAVQRIFTNDAINIDELNQLVDVNQGLLSALGVSHPKLDEVFQIAAQYGFSAKLTGAGGGGCAFCLVPPGSLRLKDFMVDLERKGFSCWRTKVGGSGVLLHQNIEEFRQSRNNIPKYFEQYNE